VLPTLVVLLLAHDASAQPDARPRVEARRIAEAPTIDGVLDDAAWDGAGVARDFIQRDPIDGAPATLPTECRIVFDDTHLYVGVRAHDPHPDQIVARLSRRDTMPPSDRIAVTLGTVHDRRTAFEFEVNAAGVERDARRFDDTGYDATWDAVWDTEVQIDDDGWSAELAIPLSQLRFAEGDADADEPAVWDLQVMRYIERYNEVAYWAPLSETGVGTVSRYGLLTGLETLDAPPRLELQPYMLAGGVFEDVDPANPFVDDAELLLNGGIDLFWGPDGDISVALTLNPDFGQVEADPSQINLSAFETRFAERRPFFLEASDTFAFDGPELFYSRRIGRAPQVRADVPEGGFVDPVDQTRILGAARVTGRERDWAWGVLDAVTNRELARVATAEGRPHALSVVEPLTNYLVGRVERNLRDGASQIGAMVTAVNRDLEGDSRLEAALHDQAYSAGVDFEHRWADNRWEVNGYAALSHVHGSREAIEATQRSSARWFQRTDADYVEVDPSRTSLTGFAAEAELEYDGEHWAAGLGSSTESPELEINDAGFNTSVDNIAAWADGSYRDLDPGELVREWRVDAWSIPVWNWGGDLTSFRSGLQGWTQFHNYWSVSGGVQIQPPVICDGCTRGGAAVRRPTNVDTWAAFSSDSRDDVSGSMSGWFFAQPGSETRGGGVSPSLRLRPTTFIETVLSVSYSHLLDDWQWVALDDTLGGVFARVSRHTLTMTGRFDATFTPDLSLQFYARALLFAGDFDEFKHVARPRARYDAMLDEMAVVERSDGQVQLDDGGDGSVDLEISDPSGAREAFQTTIVLRWEFLPGSVLFAVYQHRRSTLDFDSPARGEFMADDALERLFEVPDAGEHALMLKLTYWVGS